MLGADGFSRPFVVKRLRPELSANPVFIDHLVALSRRVSGLRHPSLVQLVDFGYFKDTFYLVREYVPGQHLDVLLNRHTQADSALGPSLAAYIAVELCKALEAAHGHRDELGQPRPVLHGGVAPGQVILTLDGSVKLTDLGLNLPLGATRSPSPAADLAALAYMSPEQAAGRFDLDARSDLFSLGLVLYEILTCHRAYDSTDREAVRAQARSCAAPPVETVAPDAPVELVNLLGRMLSHDRDLRPQSAGAARAELEAYLENLWVPVDTQELAEVVALSMAPADEPEMPTRRARAVSSGPGYDTPHGRDSQPPVIELYPSRREERVRCDAWDIFLRVYRESLATRGIQLDLRHPPTPGALIDVVLELPEGEILAIPGEVTELGPYDIKKDVGHISVILDISAATESRVNALVERAEVALTARGAALGQVEVTQPLPPVSTMPQAQAWPSEPIRHRVTIERQRPVLGVDLGASLSSAIVFEDGAAVAIADDGGRVAIPSLVWFRGDGEVIVGQHAANQLPLSPASTARSIKQLLGRQVTDPVVQELTPLLPCPTRAGPGGEVELIIGDRACSPVEAAAAIFGQLKAHAEEQLGREVSRAVLAYPAGAQPQQLVALEAASRQAGLEPLAMIAEPVAIAMAHRPTGHPPTVLGVCDFGGSSFTFSVVSVAGGHHQLLGWASDQRLGGDQLTLALALVAAKELHRAHGVDARDHLPHWHGLLAACERGKWMLSLGNEVAVRITDLFVELTPALMEKLASDMIERSMNVCARGLEQAGVRRSELTEVILTGSAARLPGVIEAARQLFVFDPIMAPAPELTVATGAAVQAAKLEGIPISVPTEVPIEIKPATFPVGTPSLDLSVGTGIEIEIEIDDDQTVEDEAPKTTEVHSPKGSPGAQQGRLGAYQLLAELGSGRMTKTSLARIAASAGYQHPLVLKVLREELARESEFLECYLDEARKASLLIHPNIARTFEVASAEEAFFSVIECLSGQPLSKVRERLFRDNPSALADPRLVLAVGNQVADGLHYAHRLVDQEGLSLGVVHRDLTPDNIFVTYSGQIKLLNVGVSRAYGKSKATPEVTNRDRFTYMSPEQVKDAQVDGRSDLFSLGVNLWELLAGRPLFEAPSVAEILGRVLAGEIPKVGELRPELPALLSDAVARALRRDPTARYQTAGELRDDLSLVEASLGGPLSTSHLAAMMEQTFSREAGLWRQYLARLVTCEGAVSPLRLPSSQPPESTPPTTEALRPEEEHPRFTETGSGTPSRSGAATIVGVKKPNPTPPSGVAQEPPDDPPIRPTVPQPEEPTAGALPKLAWVAIGAVLLLLFIGSGLSFYFCGQRLGLSRTAAPAVDAAATEAAVLPPPDAGGPVDAGLAKLADARPILDAAPEAGGLDAEALDAEGITDGDGALDGDIDGALDGDIDGDQEGDAEVEVIPPNELVLLRLKVRPRSATVEVDGVASPDNNLVKLRRSRERVRVKVSAEGYYHRTIVFVPRRNSYRIVRLLRKRSRRSKRR